MQILGSSPFYIIKECVLPGSDVGAQLTLRYF